MTLTVALWFGWSDHLSKVKEDRHVRLLERISSEGERLVGDGLVRQGCLQPFVASVVGYSRLMGIAKSRR